MRVSIKVGNKTFWVDCQDHWTQSMMKKWLKAGKLTEADYQDEAALEAAVTRANSEKLALIQEWSTGCKLSTVDGKEFTKVQEITPADMDEMDAPIYDLLINFAPIARAQAASLGELNGGKR